MKHNNNKTNYYSSSDSTKNQDSLKNKWIVDGDYGYIYLLENEHHHGKYKIGKTTCYIGKTPIECIQKRICSYQTGTLGKLIIKHFIRTKNAYKNEQLIKILLNNHNCDYGGGTEWFEYILLESIKEIIRYITTFYEFFDYEESKKTKTLSYIPDIHLMNNSPMIIDFEV